MKIEIPKNERMSMSGKSILTSLQNNSMATIDLLVRESIQNSLDAFDKNENYIDVKMNFKTGLFEARKLNNELELVGQELSKKYMGECQYLSIEDMNTVGLNGEINNDGNNKAGNFQKLVYEIAKPQTQDDAGGSWGYGKTVYFRVGIGLVVFYTRFKDSFGIYKQRLACTFVEDETKRDSILNKLQNNNRGIAWFGKLSNDNEKTIPIEDIEYIKYFLSIFNITPYENKQTGTKIIIPYLSKDRLLQDITAKKEINEHYYWKDDFEKTMENSILMWYLPRINNLIYNKVYQRPFLNVSINEKKISVKEDDFIFYKILLELYKLALMNNINEEYDIRDSIIKNAYVGNVTYSRLDKTAGSIAFIKVKNSIFNNEYNPYVYVGKENYSDLGNRPIICYCRKPGMIIDYQLDGLWAKNISSTDIDEMLIGIFVLNSNAILDNYISLETYVRKTEMADHSSWDDIYIEGRNVGRVIKTISNNSQKIIEQTYRDLEKDDQPKRVIGMSQKLGKLFLPPTGYGNKPSTGMKPTASVKKFLSRKKGVSFVIDNIYDYTNHSVKIDFQLSLNHTIVKICPLIATENGQKDKKYWIENVGLDYPFLMKSITITKVVINKSNNNLISNDITLKKETMIEDLNTKLEDVNEEGCYCLKFKNNSTKLYCIQGTIDLFTRDRDFSFSMNMKEVK